MLFYVIFRLDYLLFLLTLPAFFPILKAVKNSINDTVEGNLYGRKINFYGLQ